MVPSDLESRFMSDDISPEEMDRQVLEYQEKLYRVWSPEEAEAYEAELARLGHLEVAKRMMKNMMTISQTFCRTRPSPAKKVYDGTTGTIAKGMRMFSEFISTLQFTAEVAKLDFEEGAEPMYVPKPECPLCFEILPPKVDTSVYMPCCGQVGASVNGATLNVCLTASAKTICRACYCRGTGLMNFSKPESTHTHCMFPGVLELKLKKLYVSSRLPTPPDSPVRFLPVRFLALVHSVVPET